MADRIDQLLTRSRMGDIGLTPDERKELQRALYGLAPSSKRYKDIYNILRGDGPAVSSYRSPNQKEDGTWRNKYDWPTFQGPPTLDFLSDMTPLRDSAARGADAGGDPDPYMLEMMKAQNERLKQGRGGQTQSPSDTPLEEVFAAADPVGPEDMGFDPGMGYPGLSAPRSARPGAIGSDIADEMTTPGSLIDMNEELAGYEFAGMTPAQQIQLHQDPRVMAALYAEATGGADGTAAFLMPYIQGADAMSQSGLLGGATRDNTIFGGPSSDVAQLGQIEDVIDFMNQPGLQTIDTREAYRRSMERLGNTDFSQYSGDNGQPYTTDDIIGISNAALMASAPFMSRTTQAAISARLNQAGVSYKLSLATGEIPSDMSYPEYLKYIGADTWMGQ